MFENLLGGISPKLGLATLAKLMPERVGHPVEKFELRYFAQEKRIDFLVYMPEDFFKELSHMMFVGSSKRDSELIEKQNLYYKYNNDGHKHFWKFDNAEKICAIVNKLLGAKLDKEFTLELAVIHYDENNESIPIETYGIKNGEKIKQNITL